MSTDIKNKTPQKEDYLVLIGATSYDYARKLSEFIKEKEAVWSAWNFKIRREWREAILNRLKSQEKFHLIFYLSKSMGGSGKVEFVSSFDEIMMSDSAIKSPDPLLTPDDERCLPTDDFQTYTWFRFKEILPINPLDLGAFNDIDTEDPIVPSQLRSSFAYAYLPEDFEERIKTEEPIVETAISFEKDLRNYLSTHLNSLEQGLELYENGVEYQTDAGRIDILSVDRNKNFVVIELKAGNADSSTVCQVATYMGWVQKNIARGVEVRGFIVANSFSEKMKYALALIPNLKLKKYGLKFEFKNVNL